jgi:hypothetical protein
MSFVLSSWHQGIKPWDFNLAMGSLASTHIAHTVFDRMLLRAGETVCLQVPNKLVGGDELANPSINRLESWDSRCVYR